MKRENKLSVEILALNVFSKINLEASYHWDSVIIYLSIYLSNQVSRAQSAYKSKQKATKTKNNTVTNIIDNHSIRKHTGQSEKYMSMHQEP